MAGKPTPLDVTQEGPLNDLILAINFYISTGDHIGEGMALEGKEGEIIVLVPFDPRHPDDRDDARRLRSRLSEIRAATPNLRVKVTEEKTGSQFDILQVSVSPSDLRPLAAELVRESGAEGWGTCKAVIDENMPEVRAKLLNGEGA